MLEFLSKISEDSFKDVDHGNNPPGEINKNECRLHVQSSLMSGLETLGSISLRT